MLLDLIDFNFTSTDKRPIIIAGPCAAENYNQLLETALKLKAGGIEILRAGAWKPRTSPYSFEGEGEKALHWLNSVKKETGLKTVTEVATPAHVESALNNNIDIIWIGARSTTNPFAVQEIAEALKGVDIPVLVKNPINPDLELWIGALQRINRAGIKKLAAVHRGFSIYKNTIYRNEPIWSVPIELHRLIPELKILTDPSHIAGKRELVAEICQQSMDLGFDGLMIESHCNPDKALSDSKQQLSPEELRILLDNLIIRKENTQDDTLARFRLSIDEIDEKILSLLSERMKISREIGVYKKENNLTIRQSERYNEMINQRQTEGLASGLPANFISKIFENIHEESVRQQIKIIN